MCIQFYIWLTMNNGCANDTEVTDWQKVMGIYFD